MIQKQITKYKENIFLTKTNYDRKIIINAHHSHDTHTDTQKHTLTIYISIPQKTDSTFRPQYKQQCDFTKMKNYNANRLKQ